MIIILVIGVMSEAEKDLVNQIFSKMNVKMYNISFRILRSHSDAEEAVSQTFLKIMEHIEKIASLPCPQREPYCVIILRNETMNIIRQRKKAVYAEDIDYFEHNDESYNVEEEYIKTVEKEKLLSCVDSLPEDERNFIYFRFVHDMSFKKIAELLDITEEAAKKRGQRILKKLRSYYEGGGQNA
ncbi:MAG TPA: sigma-70 family RNA polymerase sigma factor [Clostridiales bacterium]|nr:sigma-70 family RNA polymerase sigma factor [Clostridiales bacterium]